MPTDLIRYDLLVQEALKSVVRRVLGDAVRDGLPGEHHFYISFRTEHPGVRLSPRLREKYPQDMTIVLQHQYDGLAVTEAGFEVGLSFSGVAERLRIPFDALTGFFDPSVQFGLKFEQSESEGEGEEAADEEGEDAPDPAETKAPIPIGKRKAGAPTLKAAGAKGPRKVDVPGKAAEPKPAARKPAKEAEDGASAEVVSLDSFRKKN